MRRTFAFFSCLCLLLSLSPAVFAAEVTVRDTFSFAPGSIYSSTDLFPQFKDVLPGDHLEETIRLENRHSGKLRISLRTEEPEENVEFLRQLQLTLRLEDAVIFSGSAAEVFQGKSLGVLQPGESKQLQVTLDVPMELRNDFAAARGDVIWVFTAEEIPEDTLIQTGQDLFPILLLAAFGFLCLALGWLLMRKRHE